MSVQNEAVHSITALHYCTALHCTALLLYVFFANTASQCNLIVNGQTIEKVNSCKYLGIIIDDELMWNLHIENIDKK